MSRFHRWTILEKAGVRVIPSMKVPLVLARCDCGTQAVIDPRTIRRKKNPSYSCGCYRAQVCGRNLSVDARAQVLRGGVK